MIANNAGIPFVCLVSLGLLDGSLWAGQAKFDWGYISSQWCFSLSQVIQLRLVLINLCFNKIVLRNESGLYKNYGQIFNSVEV